ncbi:hypothetical protein O181_030313 [Austropuccinia psidii MF-1]|uniref:Uncharacterized protein n=1 Tax=Austropuccinia psidii MF-1 TaxID=1389203 RepID=A0A9Q3H3K8_9BASI|nr:hypothetical protein [Austropuccinia psidii MF-1]
MVNESIGELPNSFPTKPPAKRLYSQVIPSTPRDFQPVLCTIPSSIPSPSPNPSTARPDLDSPIRPSPIPHPRPSPILTSQQLQPVASSNIRREVRFPVHFPAAQVFQRREFWPVRVTREDQNVGNEGQDAVARIFRRVERNTREVIMYCNDRMILGNSSEEMAAKFVWYEDEFIEILLLLE